MKMKANCKNQKPKRCLFAICNLVFGILIFCTAISEVRAQGFLPPTSSSATTTTEVQGPLLIGAKVPETLTALEANGKKRPLLTFKSAVEVMVVGFFSSHCSKKESHWGEIAHFYQDYKDWGVAFVAINAGGIASREELAKQLGKAELNFTLLDEQEHALSSAFKITGVPELVIFDESGYLRYRGPIGKDARAAIEALIGHIVPVPNPEPPVTGGCSVS
jgi:thiol-disulfide isomerase/thioredoxin